ncbi:MAG: PIN domain-containing protein [Acidobacteriota bacterium]
MNLVDTSVWIDYLRTKTPRAIKARLNHVIQSPEIATCEPILFEILRAVSTAEASKIEEFFTTVPVLATPATLWVDARRLGHRCMAAGFLPRSMDLLIAQIGIHHEAWVTTSDAHFQRISQVSSLRLQFLTR